MSAPNAPPHGALPSALTVVKLGGRTQDDPALPGALAGVWRATGGRLVVVHGGGDAVSALQRARGATPQFIGGRRVTAAADVDDLRMALSGLANKRVVAALQGAGVPALGLSGEDGRLLAAAPASDARLGLVGEFAAGAAARGAHVEARLLRLLLEAGYCPVVSSVSANAHAPSGGYPLAGGRGDVALNVNGDDAAAAVAAALGAAELFFLVDVPGVLADGTEGLAGGPAAGRVVGTLDANGARSLVASGAAVGGMAAKLEAALDALAAGVGRVRIGDVAALADARRGTAIVGGAGTAGAVPAAV